MLEQTETALIKPVYQNLKRMILNGELAQGEKIVQEKVARQLGVSRTPIVKALHLLERDMLVENLPRRGMYVKKIRKQEVAEAFYYRLAVEPMATRLACQNATKEDIERLRSFFQPFVDQEDIDIGLYQRNDEAFHHAVIELSDNRYFVNYGTVGHMWALYYKLGLLRPPSETLDDHLGIIRAFDAKDPQRAEQQMKMHLELSIARIL